MGRFPRLTPVRLSPQVPDHMTVSPHIVKIYAQPCATAEPIEPLPMWLESILLGPSAAFNTLAEASRELDDWGIHADLLRFRELDVSWQEAEGEERK